VFGLQLITRKPTFNGKYEKTCFLFESFGKCDSLFALYKQVSKHDICCYWHNFGWFIWTIEVLGHTHICMLSVPGKLIPSLYLLVLFTGFFAIVSLICCNLWFEVSSLSLLRFWLNARLFQHLNSICGLH